MLASLFAAPRAACWTALVPVCSRQARTIGAFQHGRRLSSGRANETSVYISRSHDPWFNLAFEDWLFTKTDPGQVIMYLYRNEPSVIIGRNQNPWKEINMHRLKELGIPFVRRRSGGGTVYHDLGNLNYCVLVPRESFDRRVNAELVTRALNDLDVPAYVNERHDICVEDFKISGSAFKLTNRRAYHHGTLLIDAKLEALRGVLGNKTISMTTKGVASVSSPVRNLKQWREDLDVEEVVDSVVARFQQAYGRSTLKERFDEADVAWNPDVFDRADELKTRQWMWGQTPEFEHDFTASSEVGHLTCYLKANKGKILDARLESDSADADDQAATSQVGRLLVDDWYGWMDGTTACAGKAEEAERARLLEVLRVFREHCPVIEIESR